MSGKIGKLYSNIMEKLRFEPGLDADNITIAIKDGGVIVIAGEVKSYAEKFLAEEAIKKIHGVNGIADELKINLAMDYVRSDADILKAALDALKWDFFVPNNQIKVVVTSGFITISGTVQKYYQKLSAEKAVQNLIGVIGVNNEITVLPDAQAKNIKERIIEEFNRNAKIDENSVNVEVEGGIVTLKGQVRDFDEDKEARLVAWSVPGVSKVIDQMLISWR